MSTSKPRQPFQVPPPVANSAPQGSSSYTRLIPKEEVSKVAAWSLETFEQAPRPAVVGGVRKPTLAERAAAEIREKRPASGSAQSAETLEMARKVFAPPKPAAAPKSSVRPIFGGVPGQVEAEAAAAAAAAQAAKEAQADAKPAEPAPPPVDVDKLVEEAQHAGYQDGYRNGLAALETYKRTQGEQMAAHLSQHIDSVVGDFHQRLEALEQQLAGRIAGVALELARQVVRTELKQSPELVLAVADEALGALLASARQVVLRMSPEDHALAQGRLGDVLSARGARVVPDPLISRGGCVVESDIAVVDATVQARWDMAAASIGHQTDWNGGREDTGDTEVHRAQGDDDLDGWPAEQERDA